MPKSKRNKQVELSKARKHGMEGKKKLYEEIRSCVESYANIFIFSVNDMRNSKIKSVREKWRHSRFFIGKNKVMALALGRTPEEEYRTNLHKIGERLKGEKGLLFSNQSAEEVLKWFSSYSEGDFARSGNHATETVLLEEGPLSQFPHNLEPYLRQLGLPTTLKKGVIHLLQDHTVCKEGDVLTPETAKILKLLGYEMAEFYIKIECVWSQDCSFKNLQSDSELKENINHTNSLNISKNVHKTVEPEDEEEMEVTDDMEENQESEEEEEIPTLVEIDISNVDKLDSLPDKHDDAGSFTIEENNSDIDENTDDNLKENIEENNDGDVLEENTEENDDILEDNMEENNDGDIVEDNKGEHNDGDIIVAASADKKRNNTQLDICEENENSDSSKEHEVLSEDISNEAAKKSSDKMNSTNSLGVSEVIGNTMFDKSAMQSPHLSEKRPKYSPKVTRSVAKKVVKKPTGESLSTKTPAKKVAQKLKLASETPSIKNGSAEKIEITEATSELSDSKPGPVRGKAHKRRSTGESPIERQLRNRSIKIVKKKK